MFVVIGVIVCFGLFSGCRYVGLFVFWVLIGVIS